MKTILVNLSCVGRSIFLISIKCPSISRQSVLLIRKDKKSHSSLPHSCIDYSAMPLTTEDILVCPSLHAAEKYWVMIAATMTSDLLEWKLNHYRCGDQRPKDKSTGVHTIVLCAKKMKKGSCCLVIQDVSQVGKVYRARGIDIGLRPLERATLRSNKSKI